MASNTKTLANPITGVFDDWFEIYNPSYEPVNLSGFYLTDSINNKTKYKIPDGYYVPARGYLLIWADNTPSLNRPELNELHTNFRISKNGSDLALYSSDGTLVDAVTFGTQSSDISEGRYPDGGSVFMQFSAPTPGKPNVIPGSTNNPPVIEPIPDKLVIVGQILRFNVVATDNDVPAQTLSYSFYGTAPSGAQISADGGFIWAPTLQQAPSTNTITIRVTDNGSPQASADVTFKVIVGLAPRILPNGITIANGQINLTIEAIAGKSYRIEYKNSLGDSNWIPLQWGIVKTENVWILTDTINGIPQRFYRIVVED